MLIKKILTTLLSFLIGGFAGAVAATTKEMKENQAGKWKDMSDKHLALMLLFDQWVSVKQKGHSVSHYLEEHDIHTVAIYGMGYVGERLYEELKETPIHIAYVIDQNKSLKYLDISILRPDESLPDVDAIIVTPITFFDAIEKNLSPKTNAKIISLEEILYALDI